MMKSKILFAALAFFSTASLCAAETPADQTYINQLSYRHNKLEIIIKHRTVDINRSFTSTDINSTTFTYEALSQTWGNISTTSTARRETKDITDWFIFKGGVRELSDLEFLQLVGDRTQYERVRGLDESMGRMRLAGNIAIGLGISAMLGGASLSASQSIISGGALLTAVGFFVSAFNAPAHHYIEPDFAQNKCDEYNIALKQKLNLPLNFE
jgi:hypothetical protein